MTVTAERVALLKARPAIKPDEIVELGPTSRSTVQRAISSGLLPSYTVGRSRFVKTEDALAWIRGEL